MPLLEGFTWHKDRPSEGEELFKTKLPALLLWWKISLHNITCKYTKKFVAGLHTFVLYSSGRAAAPRGIPYALGLFLMDSDPQIRGAPRTIPALISFSVLGGHVAQCIFPSAVWGLFQRTKSYFDVIGVPFFEISPNFKFFSSRDNWSSAPGITGK
jgi:hypothetical protein